MRFTARLFVASFLFVVGIARAQITLVDEVRTVGVAGAAAPVEFPFDITTAGNYEITLTDLGALGTPSTPLGAVQLAVTRGDTVLDSQLTAPYTLTFAATANTSYVIRVTGSAGATGSGLFRVDVRNPATSAVVHSFVNILAPPPGTPSEGQFVLIVPLTVPNTGSYDVSLRDLSLPQPIDDLLLALVEEGGSLIAALDTDVASSSPDSQTVTLNSTSTYRIFAVAIPATPTSGGLFDFEVRAAGGGASVLRRAVPVGGVTAVGSVELAAGAHTLAVRDLLFPDATALSSLGVQVIHDGQSVAQASAAGDVAFVAAAGTHDIYAFGAAAAAPALAGSLSVSIAPTGGAAVFSAAQAYAQPASGALAFNYDAPIANAASFRVRLADYQFPSPFQAVRLVAVQNGALVGTPLTAAGTFDIAAAEGKVSLLVVAQPTQSEGLFGVDVTPTALGPVAFETAQGVGGTITARKITVTNSASFDVRVTDLAFPSPITSLSTAVTRGADRVGLIFGAGTFFFAATPGNYFVTVIAQPAANQGAGTYALAVTERPAAPVVTLTATPGQVASGGAVDLTWSSQGATSCTASGGWSGTKAVSGTERSATITAATAFTLACTGAGGTTTQSANVTVQSPSTGNGGGGGGAFELIWLGVFALCAGASLGFRAAQRMKLAPLVLLATATLAGLSACGGAQSRYERSMDRGAEYLKKGDFAKARVEFRNAMQITPQSAEARYQLGVVAQRGGDFREALLSYRAAIDLQPDFPEAQAALARIFLLAGAPDRAMETIGPGIAKNPNDVGLLVVRGAAYAQLKKPPEARADADRAVQLDPADEGAVALLSSLLRAANEPESAIALLESTLKRRPDSVDLHLILANLQIEAKNTAAAETQLKETVKLRPKELALRYELANFYLRTQQVDAAQQVLEAAVASAPTNDDAKLVLANFLATQRSREAGEKQLRTMIAQDPDNLELRMGLGALFERTGADKEAIAVYDEVIEREADSPKALIARNRLAAYYSSHGDVTRAEGLIAEVIKANPRDSDALGLRARLAIEAGDAAAAVVDLRSVLRDMPNSADTYRVLARAHQANGEGALAEEALRKALELAPTDNAGRIELAQLLIRTGRAEASVSMLEDAVRRSPTDPQVREALVLAYAETRDLVAAARAAEDLQVLMPQAPTGFYLRGQIAQLQKNPAEAEKQYEQAIAAAPRAVDALAALSRLQVAAGRGDEAIGRVESVLAKEGAVPALRNLYGELLIATRQFERAAPVFEQIIAQVPKWWLPYRNLAIARYSLKDADGAMRAYQKGIKAVPDEMLLVVDLAALYELQKRVDDAIDVYEKFHAAHPAQDLVTNNLAKVLLTHRNDEKSLARAAELAARFERSNDPALLDTYGWSLFRRGDSIRAQQVLERAFTRAPDSGSIRYHLALVQVQAGQLKKAIDNLEIAVSSPRGFVGLAEARNLLSDLKSRAS